ncbi:MAG: ATP synthase F0 subunit B [bacterium]
MTKRADVRKLLAVLGLLGIALAAGAGAPTAAAAASAGGGLGGWIHGFNFGSGALVINPVIILIQWVNFLILLIVLNKILLRPLWKHMNERSGKIRGDLETAERDRSEAQGYVSQYDDSLAEIQRENTEAVVQLQQEMADATRARVEEIREKTNRELEEARSSIAAQAKGAASELKGRARQFASDIANRLAGRQVA